jgi:hypothetical protein
MKSMTLLNAQKPSTGGASSTKEAAGGDTPGGLTIDDLAIDDVHYQMMMWNAFALAWWVCCDVCSIRVHCVDKHVFQQEVVMHSQIAW